MEHPLKLMPDDPLFISTILMVAFGFIVYFFISKSERLKTKFVAKFGTEATKVRWVLFERLMGVLCFGIIPLIVLTLVLNKPLTDLNVSFKNFLTSLYWILGLSPLLILINYFNSNKEDNLAMYPQIRVSVWPLKLLISSALTWVAYLLAYEFMFRGFLLSVSIDYLGVWPAIALNIALYALVHVPKGVKEAVGAIPLGLLLSIITIQTGTIWVAFVVHVVLALSNEWFSLKFHPDMTLLK